MKRQRSRGRKPGGGGSGGHHYQPHNNNQPNRTLESNGPDIKVRGPAAHIYERYLQLARDATSSGDRVMGENYMQHAEHYFRMLRAMQPAAPPPQDRYASEQGYEGGEEGGSANEAGDASERSDQPDREFPSASPQSHQQHQQTRDNDSGDPRRRRGRRNRYQSDGEREGGENGEGAPREAGERDGERFAGSPERRPDRPREEREGGPEGFSTGPKPAFLRTE